MGKNETFIIAVDDFGSQTQTCIGWTILCIKENKYLDFESEVQQCIINYNLNEPLPQLHIKHLHGKRITGKHIGQNTLIIDIIDILKKFIKNGDAFYWHIFYDKTSFDKNAEFITQSSSKTLDRLIKPDDLYAKKTYSQNVIEMVKPFLPLLTSVIRFCSVLPKDSKIKFEIAEGSNIKKFNVPIAGKLFLPNDPNDLLYEYCKDIRNSMVIQWQKDYPAFVDTVSDLVNVIPASQSIPIQVADVLSNFAMAYLSRELGILDGKKARVAQLFEDAFKQELVTWNVKTQMHLVNAIDNTQEVEFNIPDAIRFQISFEDDI
jgi:hypothetical protein